LFRTRRPGRSRRRRPVGRPGGGHALAVVELRRLVGRRTVRRLRRGSRPGARRLLPAAVEPRRKVIPLSSNRHNRREEGVFVQVTSVGHAGFRIDTKAGSILCDPWVNPAYFASWFPFPDNSALDWDALGDVDYLYVSHLHRDHFD